MAKKKSKAIPSQKKGSSRKSKSKIQIDDIDLLNAHKFPESIPYSISSKIKKSPELQKRIDSLLKQVSPKKHFPKKDQINTKQKEVKAKVAQPQESANNNQNSTQPETSKSSPLQRFLGKKNL